MIELRKINKYYNKGRSNEMHVLKNITLSFEERGFVALVGKSGSGKTTLLNCIGGLDGFNSGECGVGDGVSKIDSKELLGRRNKNIGFVFQNYALIEDATVEDNIITALRIAGQSASVEKVNIVLEAVGMEKYNKRKVNTLSGGQKQRIAIARVLSVSPRIILADEPTGNLDMENSVQIVQLLKAISSETLVIMVSHERELVKAFADRIIEIANGQIVADNLNSTDRDISTQSDKALLPIKAKQLATESYSSRGIQFRFFYTETVPNFKRIDILIDGKNVTIGGDANFAVIYRIDEVIASRQNFPETSNDVIVSKPLALKSISVRDKIKNSKAPSKRIKNKISKMFSFKIQRISAIVMILTAVLVALSVSLINGATKVDSLKYRESASNAISLGLRGDNSTQKIYELQQDPLIEYLVPYISPLQMKYANRGLLQTAFVENEYLNFSVKPLPVQMISQDNIVYGKMPTTSFEAVLDRFFIDSIFAKAEGKIGRSAVFGITSAKSFLGGELHLTDTVSIKIVGISDTDAPTIYLAQDLIITLTLQSSTAVDKLLISEKLCDFVMSEIIFDNDDDVYISEVAFIDLGFVAGEENHLTINDKQYNVKGYYETDLEIEAYILSSDELERIAFTKLAASNYGEAIVKGNVDTAVSSLIEQGVSSRSLIQIEYEAYLRSQNSQMTLQLVFTITIGVAAVLFCYFSVKATVVEKKKELAIKVALGEKRIKLFSGFIVSALIFFSMFALPAYVITGLIINLVLNKAQGIFSMMNFSIVNFAWGFLILLIIPIVVTVLPLIKYLYKKPVALLRE